MGAGRDIYQNKSIELVKQAHPSWTSAQVLAEAKAQFNAGAQEFWTATFQLAKKLRPRAVWSNYGVGKCASHACGNAEYYPYFVHSKAAGRDKGNPPLPASEPPAICPTPNDNDSELP
jgi:hypothetical protein